MGGVWVQPERLICFAGLERAYSNAVSSLRGVRRDMAGEERNSLFKKKGGSSSPWRHKFVCLSDPDVVRVPTSRAERLILEEAGLWEKEVTIPDLDCDGETFRHIVLSAFPKLQDGGGFELLRCLSNSRELVLMGPKIANNPRLLRRRVGNGKVYLRPIQRNLSLEEEAAEEVVSISCLTYKEC